MAYMGHYRLIRQLGIGGFATVYLGCHVYLCRHVAVKVLHKQLSRQHGEAFLEEARILAHLEHPNIVRVLDFGLYEGTPYIVMTYIAGGSLQQRYPHGRRLPLRVVIGYVYQIASALDYLHEQGVIHRDIKLANLLLGEDQKIYLTDFGIASLITDLGQQDIRTTIGTVGYTAPEVYMGYALPESDQYALGVVTYELLAGEYLFTGTREEVRRMHENVLPSYRHMISVGISPRVGHVLRKVLAKQPEMRFRSAYEFALALDEGS